jgi:SAM-dependent methyltransferase
LSGYDLTHVPDKAHYTAQYVRGGRVFSYAHQIDTVLSFEPTSVVEIGVGAGMVAAALRSVKIDVTTIDVQPDLSPDVLASVTNLPFDNHRFDVALCCQVLEHLPFDRFVPALCELKRVTAKGVVLSLPDCSPHYEVRLRVPKLRRFAWVGTRRRDPSPDRKARAWAQAGHHWEIGYDETPLRSIEQGYRQAGLAIQRTWRVPEMPYHRFFSLARLPPIARQEI